MPIVPVIQSMINCFGLPKAVICHCGGNEIDCMSTVSLCFQLICSLYTINKMCPLQCKHHANPTNSI
jgi:hypothetical protein